MLDRLDTIDQRLLDEFQRGLPLVPRPFEPVADALEIAEDEVIGRLRALQANGLVSRVGATVRPNTIGASTLAAMAVPDRRIEEVAAIIGAEPGVNHSYLREDEWNLWFVVTAPDAPALAAALARMEAATGLAVLDLRLVRPFNIDLGFRLSGPRAVPAAGRSPDLHLIEDGDRLIVQAMSEGLPLVARPFAALASRLGRSESAVLSRLGVLLSAGILSRIGVIVRHRAIGWTANAMVVWDLPADRIGHAGQSLARHPGVTLCYQRRTVPGLWPYGLFNMIHARTRPEALAVVDEVRRLPALAGADCRVLFSTRCFKQTGALVHREAAA